MDGTLLKLGVYFIVILIIIWLWLISKSDRVSIYELFSANAYPQSSSSMILMDLYNQLRSIIYIWDILPTEEQTNIAQQSTDIIISLQSLEEPIQEEAINGHYNGAIIESDVESDDDNRRNIVNELIARLYIINNKNDNTIQKIIYDPVSKPAFIYEGWSSLGQKIMLLINSIDINKHNALQPRGWPSVEQSLAYCRSPYADINPWPTSWHHIRRC